MRNTVRSLSRPPLILRFLPLAVVGGAHLVALFLADLGVAGAGDLAGATKVWLMPALLVSFVWALPSVRSSLALWATLAIFFSWLGDVFLATPGESGFLVGLGCFFLAHVAYVFLILRSLKEKRLPWLTAIFALWWASFVLILAPFAGSLLIPIAVYGLVLAAVASTAWMANRLVAVGALFFLASDSILGLSMFIPGFTFWQMDFVIMLSYLLGQGLIAGGAIRRASAHPRTEGGISSPLSPLSPA